MAASRTLRGEGMGEETESQEEVTCPLHAGRVAPMPSAHGEFWRLKFALGWEASAEQHGQLLAVPSAVFSQYLRRGRRVNT